MPGRKKPRREMTTDELARSLFGKTVVDRIAEELGQKPNPQVPEKPKKSVKTSVINGKHT